MSETTTRLVVELPNGPVDVSAAVGDIADARAIVAVAHGAGGTYAQPFLDGFTAALRSAGIATVRFNFPYSEAGRRMPGPAAHAIATWRSVQDWATEHLPGVPFWAAGKSYGGRMASMAAAVGSLHPSGLAYLGYPLHPPGDPTKLRVEHLPAVAAPQLFLSGTNDPFVAPHEQLTAAVASCQDATLTWIDGGGHSFEIKGRKRPADEIGAEIAPIVSAFVLARV